MNRGGKGQRGKDGVEKVAWLGNRIKEKSIKGKRKNEESDQGKGGKVRQKWTEVITRLQGFKINANTE